MDPIFEEEQRHLSKTHAKLQQIKAETKQKLQQLEAQASSDKSGMSDEMTLDMQSDDMAMETYAEMEAMNRIIDNYSRSSRMGNDKLKQLEFLLQQPYFAKVKLRFKPGAPERDIYLGAAGMVDEKCRHFIVDWRSPVAETYYNQSNGETSYKANGRTITCELTQRRQFDLWEDKLNAYFDTTVAIEDPMLLASLSKNRSSQMSSITATIQKEQNRVIRHDDVDALLVNGIAGSGKTSVLLQRIAYLFYTQRDNLRPDQVYLLSPNPVFRTYIDNVLPDMGESNPRCITWNELVERLGLAGRPNEKPGREVFDRIDEVAPGMRFDQNDFCDLRVGDERVISANQARSAVDSLKNVTAGSRLAGLVEVDLLDKLHARIKRLAKSEDVHDEMMSLDVSDQIRIFGSMPQPSTEEEYEQLARVYLTSKYEPVEEMIRNADWLRVDRIGARVLGIENLSACEWLYLKIALTGCCDRHARYVMVDEVQDYTHGQLMAMARWFKNAHFMLLGDPNQAIKPGNAGFGDIAGLFSEFRETVCSCELMTSYRSSPEITALFTSLMTEDEQVKVSSVQHPGVQPALASFQDAQAWLDAVRDAAIQGAEEGGLRAIITSDKQRAKYLAKQLSDLEPALMLSDKPLPADGLVIIPLGLAKGLEFDRVVIPDAQVDSYDDSDLSRHRLYTAISRATKQVSVFAQGTMTPLLASRM